jgi:hypothetical protein
VGLTRVWAFWSTGKPPDRPDIELRISTCLSYSLVLILTETFRLLFVCSTQNKLHSWFNRHVYLCFALFSYVNVGLNYVSRSFCICFGAVKVYMKNSCKSNFRINIKQGQYVTHIWCKSTFRRDIRFPSSEVANASEFSNIWHQA